MAPPEAQTSIVPGDDAFYRIKVYDIDPPIYLELQSNNTVTLANLDKNKAGQKWHIATSPINLAYRITSSADNLILSVNSGDTTFPLFCQETSGTTWKVDASANFSKLRPSDDQYKNFSVDRKDSYGQLQLKQTNSNARYQRWVFEELQEAAPIPRPAGHDIQSRFFTLTPETAASEGPYDIIIVGSGVGGGVLAADLFETNHKIGKNAQKILLIERGNLIFHSHCLNAAGATSGRKGRDQQNDWFFSEFKDEYTGPAESTKGDWKGGPLYALGGRSSLWGLAAPRIHDDTLDNFPEAVKDELIKEYYEKAEKLVRLFMPRTRPEHQHLMDRLNITAATNASTADVTWGWGRIASEFGDTRNFGFAQGAYNTIDKLLEIMMNKPEENGVKVEHKNFKILLGSEVREVLWDGTGKKPRGVRVKTATGGIVDIPLKATTGRVVLGAGSVHSPAILLRSGVDLRGMGGLRITDHDMIFMTRSFKYRTAIEREDLGSLKLQTYIKLSHNDVALANMSVDASSFLPRGEPPRDDLPKFIMVYIMRTPLEEESNITLDAATKEPIVDIRRSNFERGKRFKDKLDDMEKFSKDVIKVIADVLKVDFVDEPATAAEGVGGEMGTYFGRTKLGGVAHECGSVPMLNPNASSTRFCLDENLKLRGGYDNVYVCDNSVFPISPEVNPTLTLVGLSLRLSRTLVPRLHVYAADVDTLYVVNHSGKPVRIWVSRRCGLTVKDEVVELGPGDDQAFARKNGVREAIFVYKIDLAKSLFSTENKFSDIPELLVANPGEVVAVK